MKFSDWIIYEDENLIALNKSSGLLSIPDREGKDISLKKEPQLPNPTYALEPIVKQEAFILSNAGKFAF